MRCSDSSTIRDPHPHTQDIQNPRTEKAEELNPADLLVRAEALVVRLVAEVPQVVELEQVNDCDVDQLLGAEGLLENQPL